MPSDQGAPPSAIRPAAEPRRVDERAPAQPSSQRQPEAAGEYWRPPYTMPQIGAEAGPPPRVERVAEAMPEQRTDQGIPSSRHGATLRPPQESAMRPVTRELGYFGEAFIGSDEPLEDEQPAQRPSILRRIFIGR